MEAPCFFCGELTENVISVNDVWGDNTCLECQANLLDKMHENEDLQQSELAGFKLDMLMNGVLEKTEEEAINIFKEHRRLKHKATKTLFFMLKAMKH